MQSKENAQCMMQNADAGELLSLLHGELSAANVSPCSFVHEGEGEGDRPSLSCCRCRDHTYAKLRKEGRS